MKQIIRTSNAPAAIGVYSQAVKSGNTVYISGQIPLVAETMKLIGEDFESQANQVFINLQAVARAAGGELSDIVRLTIYLTNLDNFTKTNEIMQEYFSEAYPARAVIGVAQLPKQSKIEIDAIMVLSD